MDAGLLDVVTCYYNPVRWRTRLDLAKLHLQHLIDSGVRVTLVECQTGDRPFELADIPGITHIPVRSKTLVWNKESLLRIGMSRLDPDWKYVCWTDADITFRNPEWASDTVHALQIYDIVQPWSDAYDLGPDDSHLDAHKSFLNLYWNGLPVVYGIEPPKTIFEKRISGVVERPLVEAQRVIAQPVVSPVIPQQHRPWVATPPKGDKKKNKKKKTKTRVLSPPLPPPPHFGVAANPPPVVVRKPPRQPWWKPEGGPHEYPHTGYAWAARRDALEMVGGLFDLAAMGASDYHMALALIGHAEKSMPPAVGDAYRKHLLEWQERALRGINYNVGYVPGTIEHGFHGRKSDRRYMDRWQIILEHGFDPDLDIMRNTQGVIELTCRKPRLRHDLDVYLRQRNEDANTL